MVREAAFALLTASRGHTQAIDGVVCEKTTSVSEAAKVFLLTK